MNSAMQQQVMQILIDTQMDHLARHLWTR